MENLGLPLLSLFIKLRSSFYSLGFDELPDKPPRQKLQRPSPVLVFDLDDTLVTECRAHQEPADIQLKFKLSDNSSELTTHNLNILNGMIELLQYVVQEQKLRIAFYSSALHTK
jgi:hypothetical protein